jgi:hypothetical protein
MHEAYLTESVVLKILESLQAYKATCNFIDIFILTGTPSVLQSANQIVFHMKNIWPELYIVHGKPCHKVRTV